MNQRPKFSISYYLIVFSFILFMETMYFSGSAVKELPYSNFKDLVQKNKVESVIIETGKIYGLLKPDQKPSKAAEQTQTATKKNDAAKSVSPPPPGFTPQQKQTPWYLNFEKKLAQSKRPAARKFNANSRSFPSTIQPCWKICNSMASPTREKSNRIFFPI
jgi:hypothetical protein